VATRLVKNMVAMCDAQREICGKKRVFAASYSVTKSRVEIQMLASCGA
jgi:hypothetical protein